MEDLDLPKLEYSSLFTLKSNEKQHSLLTNSKATLASQQAKLLAKSTDEASFLEDYRSFLKRKVELEQQFGDEMIKLAANYAAKKRAKPAEKANGLLKSWYTLLDSTRKQGQLRINIGEKIRNDIINPLRPYMDERRRIFTKYTEATQKTQDHLRGTYAELMRAKQTYDTCAKENEKAKQKYEEALKGPTGTFRKMFNIADSQKNIESLRKTYKNTSRQAQDARSEYLLAIVASTTHEENYFKFSLPYLMKGIDGTYYEDVKKYFQTLADYEIELYKGSMEAMEVTRIFASTINREQENDEFITDNRSTFAQPIQFPFEPASTDEVRQIVVDEVSKVVLSNKLSKLQTILDKLEEGLEKHRLELNRLKTELYENKLPEVQDREDNIQLLINELLVDKSKIQHQVDCLVSYGVEMLKAATTPGKLKKKKKQTCIAIYDWKGENADDLTIQKDDIITILEDGVEWIKGSVRGKEGFFPASYVRKVEENSQFLTIPNPRKPQTGPALAQALYEYKGNEESELSFQAGEIIEITNKGVEDDGWWEGRLRDGKVGIFPALFVAELGDEDLDGSETGSVRSVNSTASHPQWTDVFENSQKSMDSSMSLRKSSSAVMSISTLGSPQAQPDRVRALYDYDATVAGELSFREDDIIEVTNRNIGSDAWWEGCINGKVGQFPKAYVEEISSDAPIPIPTPSVIIAPTIQVRALYDFDAKTDQELSIRTGDVIELIDDGDVNWWHGELKGRRGLFPSTYVQRL